MPEWWSQEFPPEGGAAADGIMNQLGRPALDPLTILVREAAQNSWDARDQDVIDFSVDISRLGARAPAWRREMSRTLPVESGLLAEEPWTENTLILTISDRGTVGLGGPCRAGIRPDPDQRADFVQFIRNVGEARDQDLGGGSYGFGKGIYYTISRRSTILVDSNPVDGAGRRLMGAALTPTWFRRDQRYTGRHWWGEVAADGVPDPIVGAQASSLAEALGLPGFEHNESGTDIVIIAPDLGSAAGTEAERTPEEAMAFLRSSIVWHLWPKTMPRQDGRFMRFTAGLNGDPVPIPRAEDVSELTPFVRAVRKVRLGEGARYERRSPRLHVGDVALEVAPSQHGDAGEFRAARPFALPLRHIARMRQAELVIDYAEYPEYPDPALSFAGVFVASGEKESDSAFTAAEPPTHDAWVTVGLTAGQRGIVQNAMSFVRRRVQAATQPAVAVAHNPQEAGVGRLAARLGMFAGGFDGAGSAQGGIGNVGVAGAGGGGGGRSRPVASARPRVIDGPSVGLEDGRAAILSLIEVPQSADERLVRVRTGIVLDDGTVEVDAPDGGALSALVHWRSASTGEIRHEQELHLPAGPAEQWWAATSLVPDAVIRVRAEDGRRNA